MSRTIIGLFDQYGDAQCAIRSLRDDNFPSDDISLISSDPNGSHSSELNWSPASGAAEGAGKGAIFGGLGGLVLGLAVMTLPGLGPVLAAGPLAGLLTGVGFGAVAGGIMGAFNKMGIPEHESHYYAEGVRRGGTVVAVRATEETADRVVVILNRCGAVDINRRVAEWKDGGWTEFNPAAASTATSSRTGEADPPKSSRF